MKNLISVFFSTILLILIFWSCSSDTIEPDNIQPICKITSPDDSLTFTMGDSIFVQVDADDTDGIITKVGFYLDDFELGVDSITPYVIHLCSDSLTSGTHIIKAVAKDNSGATNDDEVRIFLNTPPLCRITTPLEDALFNVGDIILIEISAIDTSKIVKSISELKLFIDNALVFTGDNYPYSYNWNTSAYSIGNHIIKASVKDNDGSVSAYSISINLVIPYSFQRTYHEFKDDSGIKVIQTTDQGYAFVSNYGGYLDGYYHSPDSIKIVKTDYMGNIEWADKYYGNAYDIIQAKFGSLVIAGKTNNGYGNQVAGLRKLTIDGEFVRELLYDPWVEQDIFTSVRQLENGNFAAVCLSWEYFGETVTVSCELLKTDVYFSILSKFNVRGGYSNSLQITNDNNYVIAGTQVDYYYRYDSFIQKTNDDAEILWTQVFNGGGNDYFNSFQITSDGGFIMIGSTNSIGNGNLDFWLVKADQNGNKQWEKTFGGSYDDAGKSIQQTPDGGFIITGYTTSYGAGQKDVWIIKSDSSGNEEWNKTFGGTGNDEGNSIQVTLDGGYIICGTTDSYGSGDKDVWLIKTDANGSIE